MLKLNMEIHQNPRVIEQIPSCYDDIVCTIATYYNRVYYPMMAKTYSFGIGSGTALYYKNVGVNGSDDNILRDISGLSFVHHDFESIDSFKDIVISELSNNRPVVFQFDAYYCPWDQFYEKIHNAHLCIASGIDADKDELLVLDPWFNRKETISIHKLKEACGFYMLVHVEEPKTSVERYNDDFMRQTLTTSINGNSVNAFESMRMFADMFESEFSANDIDGENFFFSSYHTVLQSIIYSRCRYHLFLLYMSSHSNIVTRDDCEDFKRFINVWNNIKLMIAKAYIQKVDKDGKLVHRIAEKIRTVAADEELFVRNRILSKRLCMVEKTPCNNDACDKLSIKKIDITYYLNNRCFDTKEGIYSADFGGTNEFFEAPEKINQKASMFGDISINIFENYDKEYDNISCTGQLIRFDEPCTVKEVVVSGCGEYGQYIDILKFIGDNGETSVIDFGISDYTFNPGDNETVLFAGETFFRKPEGLVSCHPTLKSKIFAKRIPACINHTVSAIILPVCPNIHIFNIYIVT